MGKYDPLYKYLTKLPSSITEKTLTFDEIERILGDNLPNSASVHRQWWENPSTPDHHPYAQSWIAAGWKVDTVNQSDKWVLFKRG